MTKLPDNDIRPHQLETNDSTSWGAFLSHTSIDQKMIEERLLAPEGKPVGLFIFFNYRGGRIAEAYRKEMLRLLSESSWLVLAATPSAAASKWVRFEVDWALENMHPSQIIVADFGGCDIEAFHKDLPSCRVIDFRTNPSNARRVLRSIILEVFLSP